MNKIVILFSLFIIYSVIGWLYETIATSITRKKKTERGFLIGPYCPVYGFGSVFMILTLTKYKSDPLVLFIMAAVLCSALEYFTSYIMEKLFHARWWDYSDHKYNIQGRISLTTSILFGIGGIFLIMFANPFFISIIDKINPILLNTIAIMLFIIFITDSIISFVIINRFKKEFDRTDGDATEEATKLVMETIKGKSIYSKRLLNSFPNLQIKKKKSVK